MSRWKVYEYMKNVYQKTGVEPNINSVYEKFIYLPFSEVAEGVAEFRLCMERKVLK